MFKPFYLHDGVGKSQDYFRLCELRVELNKHSTSKGLGEPDISET